LALSGWNEICSPRIFLLNSSGSQISLSLNFQGIRQGRMGFTQLCFHLFFDKSVEVYIKKAQI
jgi:hypothetical protein